MAALWVAGVGRKSLTVVASGAPRREFWYRLRKEKQPVVAETVEEVKKEPILVCPPLRSQAYIPPKDLQSRLESHVKEVFGSSVPTSWQEISLEDVHMKFSFLARLADDLGHAVPNSRLHQMCRADSHQHAFMPVSTSSHHYPSLSVFLNTHTYTFIHKIQNWQILLLPYPTCICD
uniref:Large ribosomal subunit protein mL50 n=1 Tax=Bos mutus grunniens TaxID=30521 RepID=A0A8B9W0S2_BOSMU